MSAQTFLPVLVLSVLATANFGSVASPETAPRASAPTTKPSNLPQATAPRAERPIPAGYWPGAGWPSPVDDEAKHLFTLFDLLEYRPGAAGTGTGGSDDFRWDMEGWYGGDYNRLWFKSEGQENTAFKADYDIDFQLLYGRFIQKYYDFQIGGRVETQTYRGANVTRGLIAIGIEGVVPYDYDLEATLFIAQNGAVSARLTATKDLLLTQRLIAQLRMEASAAIQRVERFTTGSGFNDLELGLRLRYEIWREVAPYIGVSFDKSFGQTASLVRQEGGDPEQLRFVAGIRIWF